MNPRQPGTETLEHGIQIMLWLKDFFKSHMQQIVDEEDILDKDDIVKENIMDE